MRSRLYFRKLVLCLLFNTFYFNLYAVESADSMHMRAKPLNKSDHISELQTLCDHNNWSDLNSAIMAHLKKKTLSSRDIYELANANPGTIYSRAMSGTKKILSMNEKTGLDFKTLLPIALYAEEIMANSNSQDLFVNAKRFKRELQFDPNSHSFFIHLGTHGVKPLGEGRKKLVTRTVKYDTHRPEMMARGTTTCNMKKEMVAMRALKGLPGLLDAEALMLHRGSNSKKQTYTFITKIFNSGSLQDVFDNKSLKLTLKEKVQVATDIITGLASMHSHGFVHRDLGARNYFAQINGKGKGRKIRAVVADMGRTVPASTCKGDPVQGNTSYLSPEGFYRDKMKGSDYYSSDLFAVGCVMWQLFHGEQPAWRRIKSYKEEPMSLHNRYKQHVGLLERARSMVSRHYSNKDVKGRFSNLILKMTHPNPAKRGTAVQLQKEFEALLRDV